MAAKILIFQQIVTVLLLNIVCTLVWICAGQNFHSFSIDIYMEALYINEWDLRADRNLKPVV